MQRVRVGLTGLACVFLLVILAAAIFGAFKPEAEPTLKPDLVVNDDIVTLNGEPYTNGASVPNDPLAELGVAPGNAPGKTTPPPSPGQPKPAAH
ncbi:hypothetical protein [Flavisphingomonas formosensis]|uniref:hypothetical protein n=1 Tax=Flavisphingomonas formosensis TaxID=861534 RepID=UPI0012FC0D0B|nr:hypothetical protein [Sphingomonas formosensis]